MERAQTTTAQADPAPRHRQDGRRVCCGRPPLTLYLDTDALVKLLVKEPGTDIARDASQEADLLTSSHLAYVETRSALARMRAGRRLTASGHKSKLTEFEAMWADIAVLAVSGATIIDAAKLAEQHTLRAYDAVHLASALTLEVDDLSFACWDNDLREAAGAQGLRLVPPGPGQRAR